MTSQFPTSLDTFYSPTDVPPGQYYWQDGTIRDGVTDGATIVTPSDPNYVHETILELANSAIAALEAKVGINSSAVATSLDYLLRNPLSADPGHTHTVSAITNFPTAVSYFTNDAGYVTASSTNTFTNKSGNISQWTNDSGYVTAASSPVTSVNGATGAVILTTTNIAEGTNLYFTDERAQDAVGSIVDSTLVYVDGTPLLTRGAITGDVSVPQASNTATLATVNSNVGSFGSSTSIPSFTVNAKGLITAASGNVVVAPAGTLTGATLASNVLASSLTSVGTLTGGATGAGFTIALGSSTIAGDLPFANLTQGSARSVLGVAGNATADFASIQGTTDQVLRIDGAGTGLAFGAIDLSKSAAATGVLQAASFPALTGDVTTSAGALATTLATVNSNVGSFGSASQVGTFTVNAKGLITAASNTSIDHNVLTNLTTGDVHTQYALLAGRSGGQSLTGGTASGDDLTLLSTSHGTKGNIFFGTTSTYDQANDRWGFGTPSPTTPFTFSAAYTGVTSQNALSLTYTLTPSSDITSGSIISAGLSSSISTNGSASLTDFQSRALSFINFHNGSGTINSMLGATGAIRWTSSGNITTAQGLVGNIQPDAGSTGTVGTAVGVVGSGNYANLGTGLTVTSHRSVSGNMIAQAAGTTIAELRMLNANRPASSGTITNGYGVFIDNQTSASGTHTNIPFGLYQSGTADRNYFGSSVGIGQTAPAALLDVGKAFSAAAWTTNGIGLRLRNSTYTDTSSSGTVASVCAHGIAQPTLAASSSTTYTTASTLRIGNAPAAGTNVTITNSLAFWVDDGASRFDGDIGLIGSRVPKGWFTDLEITNAPTLNGTAATGTGGLVLATSPTIATSLNVTGSLQCDSIVNDTGLAAGVYTPTSSAATNLAANPTMVEAQYLRVGNTVTVSGRFTADPTTTATPTSFEITLPVASNFAASRQASGVAFCGAVAGMGAEITASAANDTAVITWISSDINSQTWSYTFTYLVI